MTDAQARIVAAFCIAVMVIIIPALFVKGYLSYMVELQRAEQVQKVDFLSMEGGRNKGISDDFYLKYDYYLWDSDI